MTRRSAMAGVLCLVALAAGCMSGQPGASSQGSGPGGGPAAGAMAVDALNAALAGNSVVASLADGSGSYCAFHSTETRPGGSMMLHGFDLEGDSAAPWRGLWRVEARPDADDPNDPGFVCYSYPDAGQFADCKMLRATGSQVTVLDRGGQTHATGQLVAGNACDTV